MLVLEADLALGRLLLPPGRPPASASGAKRRHSTATNSDIYVAALKASSLHFLLLPPLTPRRASVVPGCPARSRLRPCCLPVGRTSPSLVPRLSCRHVARKHKPGVNPSKLSLTMTPAPCLPCPGCIQGLLGFSWGSVPPPLLWPHTEGLTRLCAPGQPSSGPAHTDGL